MLRATRARTSLWTTTREDEWGLGRESRPRRENKCKLTPSLNLIRLLQVVLQGVFYRDLTIRQRRRPWKLRWKIDIGSFKTFSRLSQFALLLKRRGFWLELKRGERAQVRTEMVEFIALPFPFPSNLKIWSFHIVVSDADSLAFGGRLKLFCLVSRSPALVHKSPAFYVHYKYWILSKK